MGILNSGRFGMGAALTGTMKTAIAGSIEYANSRVQFQGRKIGEYQAIRDKIASMTSRLYATESMAYLLAANMDRGMTDYQIEAACGKVFASENAWYCVDETIQIYGGIGFMRALPYERMLRDLRIFRIFEGTNGACGGRATSRPEGRGEGRARAAADCTWVCPAGHSCYARVAVVLRRLLCEC